MNKFILASVLILVFYCHIEKEEETDRFVFKKNTPSHSGKFYFLQSKFHKISENQFEEITWITCNEFEMDVCFDKNADDVSINSDILHYGSFLFSPKNEYIHVKLRERTGWLKTDIPIPDLEKKYYKELLKNFIKKDSNRFLTPYRKIISVSGFITITHFKDQRIAFLKYYPILIQENFDYNMARFSEGYIIDLNTKQINQNALLGAGKKGMNLISDSIFEIGRDPFFYLELDKKGRVIKKE